VGLLRVVVSSTGKGRLVAGRLLQRLKKVSATTFENIVFDVLVRMGLRNATWRTPGADAGRDIEGVFLDTDFSGTVTTQRWYVECKRYSSSVDWPTVHEKIAYAHNHQAHCLLLCTTATLSPRCKEEVLARERRLELPLVRYWDGPIVEQRVAADQAVLAKYGLEREPALSRAAVTPLLLAGSKAIQAAYGLMSAGDRNERELELAAALVELASARLSNGFTPGLAQWRPFTQVRDVYSWCRVTGGEIPRAYDSYALRAFFAAVRFLAQISIVRVTVGAPGSQTNSRSAALLFPGFRPTGSTAAEVLNEVLFWSNFEMGTMRAGTLLQLRQRDRNGRLPENPTPRTWTCGAKALSCRFARASRPPSGGIRRGERRRADCAGLSSHGRGAACTSTGCGRSSRDSRCYAARQFHSPDHQPLERCRRNARQRHRWHD